MTHTKQPKTAKQYLHEAKFHARLIAAAPEMYELLLDILDDAEVHPKTMIPLSDIGMKARRIKAAIDGE